MFYHNWIFKTTLSDICLECVLPKSDLRVNVIWSKNISPTNWIYKSMSYHWKTLQRGCGHIAKHDFCLRVNPCKKLAKLSRKWKSSNLTKIPTSVPILASKDTLEVMLVREACANIWTMESVAIQAGCMQDVDLVGTWIYTWTSCNFFWWSCNFVDQMHWNNDQDAAKCWPRNRKQCNKQKFRSFVHLWPKSFLDYCIFKVRSLWNVL